MTKRTLSVTLAGMALLGVAGLGVRGTASRAQTPVEKPPAVSESLEQKVARLERQVAELQKVEQQVADLQKQVEELKRRPALTVAPSIPFGTGGLHSTPTLFPGATPFPFNGDTYYHIPLQKDR